MTQYQKWTPPSFGGNLQAPDMSNQPEYKDGYQVGYAAGIEQAKQETLAASQKQSGEFVQMQECMEAEWLRLGEHLVPVVISLVEQMTTAIMKDAVMNQPDLMAEMVKATVLSYASQADAIQVMVHPQQLEQIQRHLPPEHPAFQHIKLVACPQVTIGGCRLDSAVFQIDDTLETKLAAVIEDFRDQLQLDQGPGLDEVG